MGRTKTSRVAGGYLELAASSAIPAGVCPEKIQAEVTWGNRGGFGTSTPIENFTFCSESAHNTSFRCPPESGWA